jgi:hypothetical protein
MDEDGHSTFIREALRTDEDGNPVEGDKEAAGARRTLVQHGGIDTATGRLRGREGKAASLNVIVNTATWMADPRDLAELQNTQVVEIEGTAEDIDGADGGQGVRALTGGAAPAGGPSELGQRELRFLTYVLNALFNVGPKPFDITDPPVELVADLEWPVNNLLWRRMMTALLAGNDPRYSAVIDLCYPKKDMGLREIVNLRCAQDPVFFANGFVYGYDARLPTDYRTKPFILWDRQKELLLDFRDAIDCRHDICVKKGGDVGVSSIFEIMSIHGWDFHKESFLWTTKDKDVLDGKGPHTVFGRMRDILRRLPYWMWPPGWSWSSPLSFSKLCCLTRPEMVIIDGGEHYKPEGAVIKGKAAKEEAGISERYAAAIFDEFAVVGQDYEARDEHLYEATGGRVNCRATPSTPRTYHERLYSGRVRQFEALEQRKTRTVFINWTHDPRKNGEIDGGPMVTMMMRPATHTTSYEKFGLMLKLYDLEQKPGHRESLEWRTLIRKFRPLDPIRDAVERRQPLNRWYLRECLARAKTEAGARMIRPEVDGEAMESDIYLFPEHILLRIDVRQPAYGSFKDLRRDHRTAHLKWQDYGTDVQVWRKPGQARDGEPEEMTRHYIVTTDVGAGVGKDFTVLIVWDVTSSPIEQVAMVRDNRIGPEQASFYAYALHAWYNDGFRRGLWTPESNAEGTTMISYAVNSLGFPRHRTYKAKNRATPTSELNVHDYGYYSVRDGRISLISRLHEIFERPDAPLLIHSDVVKNELSSILASREDRYPPDEGCHDDTVIACALLVPGLEALNQMEFGTPIFDVVGPRWMARQHQREERRREWEVERARQDQRVDEDIPIWAAG